MSEIFDPLPINSCGELPFQFLVGNLAGDEFVLTVRFLPENGDCKCEAFAHVERGSDSGSEEALSSAGDPSTFGIPLGQFLLEKNEFSFCDDEASGRVDKKGASLLRIKAARLKSLTARAVAALAKESKFPGDERVCPPSACSLVSPNDVVLQDNDEAASSTKGECLTSIRFVISSGGQIAFPLGKTLAEAQAELVEWLQDSSNGVEFLSALTKEQVEAIMFFSDKEIRQHVVSLINSSLPCPLRRAIRECDGFAEFLIESPDYETDSLNAWSVLTETVESGSVKLVKLLLNSERFTNESVNKRDRRGLTALHAGCWEGCVDCARLLLECERFTDESVNTKDVSEMTALHRACNHGSADCASLLLECERFTDESVNTKDKNERTALHSACFQGNVDCARLLLECERFTDESANARNTFGTTALIYACESMNEVSTRLLLECGRLTDWSVNARAEDGNTALDVACYLGSVDCARLLLECGSLTADSIAAVKEHFKDFFAENKL